jgi:O-acetyl-ADP-ribose deacetylase (regulator of RNase III)
MSLQIFLVDIDSKMCLEWQQYNLPKQIKIVNESIKNLNLKGTNVFVSPANSMGLMRGGIDNTYREMFPHIENDVLQEIRKLGYQTTGGDYFLPVSSALLIKPRSKCTVEGLSNCDNYLICCPSMLLPGSNIQSTDNVFNCYKAIMTLVKKMEVSVDNLIIPGIGTGIGGQSQENCARDFYGALIDRSQTDESPNSNRLVLNRKLTIKQSRLPQYKEFRIR